MNDENVGIASRLKALRKERGVDAEAFAKAMNVSLSAVRRWEAGSNRPVRKIKEIAKYYNVTTDYLIYGKESESDKQRNIVRVPVLGRVAAGIPIEAIQEVDDWEEIYHPGAGNDKFFGLRIHGASMEPRLREGDTVIVKKQDYFESGDVCIVLVNGNEATVKVVQKKPNGIVLIGYNAAVYPPHFYSAQEVETLPVRIIGVVIEFRCKP